MEDFAAGVSRRFLSGTLSQSELSSAATVPVLAADVTG